MAFRPVRTVVRAPRSFVTSVRSCVHVSVCLMYQCVSHWTDIRYSFYKFGTFMETCRETADLVKYTKISGTLYEESSTICCCWRNKFAITAFLCNTQHYYVTCSSTVTTEWIFAFQLKQWLSERATMLHYTYIAYLVGLQFLHILSHTASTTLIIQGTNLITRGNGSPITYVT